MIHDGRSSPKVEEPTKSSICTNLGFWRLNLYCKGKISLKASKDKGLQKVTVWSSFALQQFRHAFFTGANFFPNVQQALRQDVALHSGRSLHLCQFVLPKTRNSFAATASNPHVEVSEAVGPAVNGPTPSPMFPNNASHMKLH